MSTTHQGDGTPVGAHSGADLLRAFNKRVRDPAMMLVAGRRYWDAAVIRHTGRRSGTAYATPVVADQVMDGFIIPLLHGTRADWLRNVLATGHAIILFRGENYPVTAPRIIDADTALAHVPATHRRVWRRLGIKKYLRVNIATEHSPH